MKRKLRSAAIIFSMGLLLIACNADMEKPVITLHEPSEEATFRCGDTLTVDFTVTDNEALNQFKIDLHGDHDGHTHGKLAWLFPAFDTIIVENLSGTTADRHIRIPVASNAWPGPYHVTVFATDLSGNEQVISRNIHLVNYTDTVAPDIVITAPAEGATLGSSFTVSATITDVLSNGNNGEIRSIKVLLVQGATEYLLGNFDEANNFGSSFTQATGAFSKIFNKPNEISSGTYELEIEAYDSYFNHTHSHVSILIP